MVSLCSACETSKPKPIYLLTSKCPEFHPLCTTEGAEWSWKALFSRISLVTQGFNFVLQETFDSDGYTFYWSTWRGGHYHCHLVGRSQNLLHFPQCTGQSPQQGRIWSKRSEVTRMGTPSLDLAQPSFLLFPQTSSSSMEKRSNLPASAPAMTMLQVTVYFSVLSWSFLRTRICHLLLIPLEPGTQ